MNARTTDRLARYFAAAILALTIGSLPLNAQDHRPAADDATPALRAAPPVLPRASQSPYRSGRSAPSYDSTALRIEQHGGGLRIVRGLRGPVVWSQEFMFTRGDLEQLVAPSASAVEQARFANRTHRRGIGRFAVGFGAFVASLLIGGNNRSMTAATVLGVSGSALMLYSRRDLNAAATAVSRAVFLHNADLAR